MLKDGEEIFDLQCDGLKIIQHPDGYAFTTDAVLLANTVRAAKGDRVLELGTGSGVIALLVSKKTNAGHIDAVEIQPRLADMARRSVELNGLSDRIDIIESDMKELGLSGKSYDVVCTNPPYMTYSGDASEATENEICKSEVSITVAEVVNTAAKALKYGGKFYVVLKSERLTDLIYNMRLNNIEPKIITPVQPTAKKDVDTVLVTGIKNGKSGVKVMRPLVITEADGSYTETVRRMYFNECDPVRGGNSDRKS